MTFETSSPGLSSVGTSAFWEVYDRLIAEIPAQATIDGFSAGMHWFGLRASGGIGLAMAPRDSHDSPSWAGSFVGRSLRTAAELSKSWNHADSAAGLAAINAWHNEPGRVRSSMSTRGRFSHGKNAFEHMRERITGRRVAVIGHFRNIERLSEICDLQVLERRQQPGDLPDPSCEVILPSCDYVFITGTTLINKTFPRLLELSANAHISVVGPTTPLSPALFDMGVNLVAGVLSEDVPGIWSIVSEGGKHEFFDRGTRLVQIEKE